MKQLFILMAMLVWPWQSQAANDYPTEDIVRNVIDCMTVLGGLNDHNLYTCACRADHIMANLTFAEYDDAQFWDHNRQMTGKRGGMVRDNEKGKINSKKYEEVLNAAEKSCPVVKHIDSARNKSRQSEMSQ